MKLYNFNLTGHGVLSLELHDVDPVDAIAFLGQVNALVANFRRDKPAPVLVSDREPEPAKEDAKPAPKKEAPKAEPKPATKPAENRAAAAGEAIKKDIEAREKAKEAPKEEPKPAPKKTEPKEEPKQPEKGLDLAGDGLGDDDIKRFSIAGDLPENIVGAKSLKTVVCWLQDNGYQAAELIVKALEQLRDRVPVIAKFASEALPERVAIILASYG
jgi:hypothetical protein